MDRIYFRTYRGHSIRLGLVFAIRDRRVKWRPHEHQDSRPPSRTRPVGCERRPPWFVPFQYIPQMFSWIWIWGIGMPGQDLELYTAIMPVLGVQHQ